MLRFVRTTFVGGILFLVPFVVVLMVLGRALGVAHAVMDPLSARLLPVELALGIPAPRVVAVAALVLVCFGAGLLARTALARGGVRRLEEALLARVPGYALTKRMGEDLLGVEQADDLVVLVRFDDSWELGFQVDALPSGEVAVFLPGAPQPQSGRVAFVAADRVRAAGISAGEALKLLKRLGAGSGALLRELPR